MKKIKSNKKTIFFVSHPSSSSESVSYNFSLISAFNLF